MSHSSRGGHISMSARPLWSSQIWFCSTFPYPHAKILHFNSQLYNPLAMYAVSPAATVSLLLAAASSIANRAISHLLSLSASLCHHFLAITVGSHMRGYISKYAVLLQKSRGYLLVTSCRISALSAILYWCIGWVQVLKYRFSSMGFTVCEVYKTLCT